MQDTGPRGLELENPVLNYSQITMQLLVCLELEGSQDLSTVVTSMLRAYCCAARITAL